MVERLRMVLKFVALALATGAAAAVPLAVRLATFGAPGPSSRIGSRCCRLWSKAALWIVGVDLDVDRRPDGGVFVVAANHVSYLDIWVLGSQYPTTFVAKGEIRSWPLFGTIARAAGTLFVDRDSPRALVMTSRAMSTHIERGLSVTLFPEGKATAGQSVLAFMPSLFDCAAKAGIPCYAASLSYDTPGRAEPPADTVCWWGGQRFLPHALQLFRLPRIRATLRVAGPILSNDRKELARRLHAEVAQRFVPVRQEPLENVS